MSIRRRFLAIIGACLGLAPVGWLVFRDRSMGHGSEFAAFIEIALFGLPLMIIASVVGEILQHGFKSSKYIAVPIGAVLGGVAAMILSSIAPFGFGSVRTEVWLVIACAVGAVVGILIAGFVSRG